MEKKIEIENGPFLADFERKCSGVAKLDVTAPKYFQQQIGIICSNIRSKNHNPVIKKKFSRPAPLREKTENSRKLF